MKMQLILNADSTANIKTKMSLNEENLEKCVTINLPAAANRDLSNGDHLKVIEHVDLYTDNKLGQIKTIEQNKANELNQVHNICKDKVDIDLTKKKCETSDPVPEDDKLVMLPTCEHDTNGLKQFTVNSESVNLDITAEQKETDNDIGAKVASADNAASNSSAASEITEDKSAELTNIEKQEEIQHEKSTTNIQENGSSSTGKGCMVSENSEIEDVLHDKGSCNNSIETSEPSISQTENNEESTSNNDKDAIEDQIDTTVATKETEIKRLDDTIISSMDVCLNNDIEKENGAIVMDETKITNDIRNIMENQENSNEKDDIVGSNLNDNEIMITESDSTADNLVIENKLEANDFLSKVVHVKNIENDCSEKITDSKDDTDIPENKPISGDHKMEVEEEDNCEEINSANIKEGDSMCDMQKTGEVNMNNDELAKSPLVHSNEASTTNKGEIMNVTPDSSDDIIFNLDDDDKDPSSNLIQVKEAESANIVIEDDKHEAINKVDISGPKSSGEVIDLDDSAPNHTSADSKTLSENIKDQLQITEGPKSNTPVLQLSNTLDILSDEEDDAKDTNEANKCINIEDDDDVMLIDEEVSTEKKSKPVEETKVEAQTESKPESSIDNMEVTEENERNEPVPEPVSEPIGDKSPGALAAEKEVTGLTSAPEINDKVEENKTEVKKSLMHEKFLKTCKKSLADMTREELEEFCIVKIVESILDRSNLSEIRTKLKTMTQNVEDYKKKAMMLTKQNRDLQVVLKSIQEDQKKGSDSIVPLKITRSVGMQVLMSDKPVQRRKTNPPAPAPAARVPRQSAPQSPRPHKPAATPIPVPRLVPANTPALKSPTPQANTGKIPSPVPNGVRNPSPVQKGEKRTHNRMQSVTVDLTDDEPPPKQASRAPAPVPPVRLVPSQNLLAPPRPQTVNSPRKVYIPISGPQGQNVRPGQTIMLKTVPPPPGGPRTRAPSTHMVRMPPNMRMPRPHGLRHPAPLPDCMKQYQPPNWKALPPAPDLKLAKVENGIVISWKIEGYQENSYEEIASYQLYAYQETSSPPSTALWKKIGDVKALPLPMACTLTQFMAGYKYYFAVRAVDIRSRLGPFSLPGSILLLNKM